MPQCALTRVGESARSPVYFSRSVDSTLLLATHSADKRLRFYRVSIDFQQMLFNTQHLKTLDNCSPLEQPSGSSSISYEASCQLSHLHLLPSGPETGHKELKEPIILAIFSQILDNTQDPTPREGLCSVLARWEFCSRKPTLHPGFEQLMPRKPNALFPGGLPVSVNISPTRLCAIAEESSADCSQR